MRLVNVQQADDAVQGCVNVVAYAGKEIALGGVDLGNFGCVCLA